MSRSSPEIGKSRRFVTFLAIRRITFGHEAITLIVGPWFGTTGIPFSSLWLGSRFILRLLQLVDASLGRGDPFFHLRQLVDG